MTLNESHFDIPRDPPPYSHAVHRLNQLQAELVITARMWAMDEVSAAVTHQLNEPLAALLVHLHEIELAGDRPSGSDAPATPVWEIARKAVREAERVCDILERMRHRVEAPVDTQSAAARGREATDAWARSSRQNGGVARQPLSRPDPHPLTPREREVLTEITAGASNKEGSKRLGISTRTFEAHRAHIMRKVGARNAADLVRTVLVEIR